MSSEVLAVATPGPTSGEASDAFSFTISKRDARSRARRGRLVTPHGAIETPAFIFCATKAAMKAATTVQVAAADTQIILANTYHLMLQPGADLVAKLGGLHKFMAWDGPMLTDSGGFQIFSLGAGGEAKEIKGNRNLPAQPLLIAIEEEGAVFRSFIDGTVHKLRPEDAIGVQRRLGADIILVLDECPPYHKGRDYAARSMEMTHRWEKRSLAAFEQEDSGMAPGNGSAGPQGLYGIIQGGTEEDLRRESAEFVESLPFFGIAVGGTLGGDKDLMYDVMRFAMRPLTSDRPVHLLGIGGMADIFEGVELGIDTFDCVTPTRTARHGGALVPPSLPEAEGRERLNLRNARFRDDPTPLWRDCSCETCRTVSRAYVHHLLKADEILGLTLLTIHNIAVMNRLMADIRAGLDSGLLPDVRRAWLGR